MDSNNCIKNSCDLFEDGFHCSQAVFAGFSEKLGLDKDTALKIGGCFGSGMNKGEVCGAVTGALMAIGLKYGQSDLNDSNSRQLSAQKCCQYLEEFKKEKGSYMCRDLLGYDFSDKDDLQIIIKTQCWRDICPEIVKYASELLDRML